MSHVLLLEVRKYLLKLGQECSFPVYCAKSSFCEMKAGSVTIYASETILETILESKFNNLPWGKVVVKKPYKSYLVPNIAVQLLTGMTNERSAK